MDRSFTYGTRDREHLMIYVEPGFDPPDILMVTRTADSKSVEFIRLSDMSLECETVRGRIDHQGKSVVINGECTNGDCHRRVLGECQCGRHTAPVRFERAV